MMYVDLTPDDSVVINGANIKLERKSGNRARLRIDAPKDISIIVKKDKKDDGYATNQHR